MSDERPACPDDCPQCVVDAECAAADHPDMGDGACACGLMVYGEAL